MRAFLYIGGEIDASHIDEQPEEGDLILAADSGWNNAMALGVRPGILLGDFDSLGEKRLAEIPSDVEILQVPAEKDMTDTQLGISVALSRGAKDIVMIGGLSGRLDHTLSNLAILEMLHGKQVHGLLCDGKNRIRFVRDSGTILVRSHYRYVGLWTVDRKVRGVSIEGGKYPLKNATLYRTNQYAVSNEIVGNCMLIEVRHGGAFVVESAESL